VAHQITHIRKSGSEYDCTCITDVKTSEGNKYPVKKVIDMIIGKDGDDICHYFYVEGQEGRIPVKAIPNERPTYIRTAPNDTPNDNLLQLPTF